MSWLETRLMQFCRVPFRQYSSKSRRVARRTKLVPKPLPPAPELEPAPAPAPAPEPEPELVVDLEESVSRFQKSYSQSLIAKKGVTRPEETDLVGRHVDPVETCQLMLGYRFRRIELLREALKQATCQRLALVGDRTLSIAMVSRFFWSKAPTHQWQDLAIPSASNEYLYMAGLQRGVHLFTIPPLSAAPIGCKARRKRVADAVEAIVGAVFEDCLSANRTINWNELEGVIYRLGLVPEFLVTAADRRKKMGIKTDRRLPTSFFKGHQTALHDTLFEYMTVKMKEQTGSDKTR